jgi:serine/threonine protein kinase
MFKFKLKTRVKKTMTHFRFDFKNALVEIQKAYPEYLKDDTKSVNSKFLNNIPGDLNPLITFIVEKLSFMFAEHLYKTQWGIKEEAKSALQYANDNKVRTVKLSRSRTLQGCLAAFDSVTSTGLQGGFGSLYRGKKKGVTYAIKRVSLNPNAYDVPKGLFTAEIIQNEIRITKKMSDLGIGPKLYDIFICKPNGEPYIFFVLEYFNQNALDVYLYNGGIITPDDTKSISKLINRMHAAGVVHTDLHPGNILVNLSSTGKLRFAISDFGLAKFDSDHVKYSKSRDHLLAFTKTMEMISNVIQPMVYSLFNNGKIKVEIAVPNQKVKTPLRSKPIVYSG